MVDRVELVTNDESIEMARRLAREEGLLSGISSAPRSRRPSGSPGSRIWQEKPSLLSCRMQASDIWSSPLFEGMFND